MKYENTGLVELIGLLEGVAPMVIDLHRATDGTVTLTGYTRTMRIEVWKHRYRHVVNAEKFLRDLIETAELLPPEGP